MSRLFSGKGEESKHKAFEEILDLEWQREHVAAVGTPDAMDEVDEINARIAENTKVIGAGRLASARRSLEKYDSAWLTLAPSSALYSVEWLTRRTS